MTARRRLLEECRKRLIQHGWSEYGDFIQSIDAALSEQESAHLAPEPDPKAHRRCVCEFSGGGVWAKRCAFHDKLLSKQEPSGCEWVEDPDGYWQSACGSYWTFPEEGPRENGMKFCHQCGGRLILPAAPAEKETK